MKHWEDRQIYTEHLMDAHPSFREDMASLNGKWRYQISTMDSPTPDDWTASEYDDKKWHKKQIPCLCVPVDQGATEATGVCFRRSFILSKNLGNRKVILRLEHIDSCTVLWINGQYIGMSRDTAAPQEFDITSAVHPERNVVAILVHRDTGTTSKSEGMPGLPGSVSLYTLPSRYISDLQYHIVWEDSNRPLLKLKINAQNADGFSARIALMDGSNILHYVESKVAGGSAYAQIPCPNVQLWSSEIPKLYSVAVILWDGIANYHTRQLSIGFRRNVIQDGILTWNGQNVKLFGVTFDPELMEEAALELQLKSIRQHNFNTVFLKNDSEPVLEICDRLGLYVIVESGTAEHPEQHTNPSESGNRMAAAFGHHPCLIAWNADPITDMVQSISAFSQMEASSSIQTGKTVPQSGQPVLLTYPHHKNSPFRPIAEAVRSEKSISGVSFGKWQIPETTLRELESAIQPICCTYDDGVVTLTNHNRFLNSDGYICQYVLSTDGNTVTAKSLTPKAAPGATVSFPIETKYDIYRPGRYYLDLLFRDSMDGHLVSREQWPIAVLPHIRDENPGGSIREETGDVLMRSMDASYIIGREHGNVDHIRCKDEELLQELRPLFTKGATRSGSFRISSEWEKISDRKKRMKPSVFEVDHMTRTITVSYHIGSGVMQSYRLFSDGSLSMELRVRTGKTVPQRLAVSCNLSEQFRSMRWFGLGPDDSGAKHPEGRYYGIHEMTSATENVPCTKDSVYSLWLNFRDQHTLHIRSDEGLQVTLLPDSQSAGTRLILEQPLQAPMKPHTTYTLSFTMQAIETQ